MNKKAMSIIIVLVLVGLGAGAYFTLNKSSNEQPSSSSGSTNSTLNKELDLSSALTALKQKYPTVEDTYIYTESRDPNGNLGKAGFYVAGAEFYDTRTNTSPDGEAFGNDSGGAIEVYASASDAAKRAEYLKSFQGNALTDPGAFKQVGKVVIRVSSQYTASLQNEMLDYLESLVK
jgi:hypothetical protein